LKYYEVISNPQVLVRLNAIVNSMHLQDTWDMRKVQLQIFNIPGWKYVHTCNWVYTWICSNVVNL